MATRRKASSESDGSAVEHDADKPTPRPATKMQPASNDHPASPTALFGLSAAGSNDWVLAGVKANNEKLKTEIKRLKKDLEMERRNIKELYVLHQGDLRQIRQQEQDRAQALICDLKAKWQKEKSAELTKQKDKLNRGHEVEIHKLKKEHEDEFWRLSAFQFV